MRVAEGPDARRAREIERDAARVPRRGRGTTGARLRAMRNAAITSLLVTLLGAPGCSSDSASPPSPEARVAEVLTELEAGRAVHDLPGVAVAVALDGRLAFSAGLGVRSREGGEPVTPHTLFRTGSLATKPLVAATLLDLAEDGLLDLDAPIAGYLPYLRLDPRAAALTSRQALSMQSGLMMIEYRAACLDPSLEAYFTRAGTLRAHTAPGELFMYLAVGYDLGAAVIEQVAGRPWREVMLARLLGPMGMGTATFDGTAAKEGDHAVGYVPSGSGGESIGYELDTLPWCPAGVDCSQCDETAASAGLIASVEDIAHFVERMLAPGEPLTAAAVDEMTGPQASLGAGEGYTYGFGTLGLTVRGERFVFGLTSFSGVDGKMAWIPARGFGVVLLANSAGTDASYRWLHEETVAIATRFLDLRGELPDLSTPPSTWSRYVGRYADPQQPQHDYEVALQESGALVLQTPHGPVPLQQGSSAVAYVGGDSFWGVDPASGASLGLSFFTGTGGTEIRYLVGDYFVAERAP